MDRKTPKENFDACDNFFVTVVNGHVVAAALEFLGMKSPEDPLPELILSKQRSLYSQTKRSLIVYSRFVKAWFKRL